ncbi:phosphatidylserine decarboxylase-domain-containing protein [Daldinia loculata]|uniref:phosphatidylserine decarboxylase-domain-containing protein n=1 Tax=Daldinia loculata TaxID=103429 RepID=UPI0020C38601|nr:phosphatidylserine decarboxylase-domain-containing protein [Daldinia loculata]KAI1641820.1 phosphatidylserine decarboxylase-domain-containing protein [Daldinia loculata]
MDTFNIIGVDSFLKFANDLLKWIPHEGSEGQYVYNTLCMFYFVFNQSPLKELQTPITPDASGRPLTWLSSWLVVYSQLVGLWMDTTESLTEESLESFKQSKHYNVDEALPPPGGWKTFNEFFSRQLKADARPIESPLDDKVIVYPADCKYDSSVADHVVSISSTGTVLIKNLPWTIGSLLQGSEYADEFNGGVWMHGFLNTYNYHRQHAPVSGEVIEAKIIQGSSYVEVDVDGNKLQAPLTPGFQFMQTRGLIIINNAVLGKVAVLPIGMAVVSSVKLLVRKNQQLKKGDEISTFLFGGSDIVCVFQRKAGLAVESFVPSAPGKYSYSKMGSTLANAP